MIGSHPDWDGRIEVIDLRSDGLTFQEIGDQLGVSRQAAHQLWWRTMHEVAMRRMRGDFD